MQHVLILPLLFIVLVSGQSQTKSTTLMVFEKYDMYREPSLKDRRFKHGDILPLIQRLEKDKRFRIKREGKSIQGRDIYSITMGSGSVNVLLWSQMHGDEATATAAIFDLMNFFSAEDEFSKFKKEILSKLTLCFIPMLNPDGAELFQRRNALGVDLNRDALRLQSPEARILKNKRDELQADFGFNLHDQGRVYSAGNANFPATISFLAPAYNYAKEVNEVRGNAIKLISLLTRTLQEQIPNHLAKYSDDFEPRAFGDNIQKWGTSVVLIESGGNRNDREKQEIRKINFLAMLTAFQAIAGETYKKETFEEYDQLPFNEKNFFDLLIQNVTIQKEGSEYKVDIAINQEEVDFDDHRKYYLKGSIEEVGDLSVFYGYEKLDGKGLMAVPGKVYPESFSSLEALKNTNKRELLQKGYLYVRIDKDKFETFVAPVNILNSESSKQQNFELGDPASFLLMRGELVEYVVLNGFLINLKNSDDKKTYGIID